MSFEIDGLSSVDILGRGGFGTVYRATDMAHGREVAVKVLPPVDGDAARRRFDRERRAMGTLSGHPSIGIVHTSGYTKNDEPYIVMEMLTGGSYGDLVEAGPMDSSEVIELGIALADALEHAHRGGVLHLDLKPENILLSEFGRPKIVDFGIASLADDEIGTTTIRATPAFADPEVLDGRPGTVQSDVYGLAATLYTMLNGEAPYSSGDTGAFSIMRRVAVDEVPYLQRDDVPEPLTALLHRAMSKDPAGRPTTMAEFGAALAAINDDEATPPRGIPITTASATVTSPPISQPVSQPAWQHPTGEPPSEPERSGRTIGLVLVGVAAVLLVGIVAFLFVRGGDDAGESDASVATTDDIAGVTTVVETVPPTTVPPTTAAPTTVPLPSPVIATNPRFAVQLANGFPDPVVVTVPDGANQLCLVWDYQGFEPGAAYILNWRINGVIDESETGQGTNQGGIAGTFFGCVSNAGGLVSGLFEAEWSVEGQPVFSHPIFVGGGRSPVTIGLQNNTVDPICGAHWAPLGGASNGITRNLAPIAPGQLFTFPLATGTYTTRILDCSGNVIFEERAGTEFVADITLTLPA